MTRPLKPKSSAAWQYPRILCGDHEIVVHGNYTLIVYMPPYNIGSRYGHDHPGVKAYFDDEKEERYQLMQRRGLSWACKHLEKNGQIVYMHKNRRFKNTMIKPEEWIYPLAPLGLAVTDEIILDRQVTHNHCMRFGWPRIEKLFVFRRAEDSGSRLFVNNTSDGLEDSYGDVRDGLWKVTWQNSRTSGSAHDATMPLSLAARIIHRWCPPGGSVCDPYLGTATSAIAALERSLPFTGSEIKPCFYRESMRRVTAWMTNRQIDHNNIQTNR